MSFWSKLAKIGTIAGAGAATIASMGAASPALAGALGSIGIGSKALGSLGTIGKFGEALSPVVGGIAKGRAEGRQADVNNTLAQNQQTMSYDQMVNNAARQQFADKLGLVDKEAGLLDLRAAQTRRGDLQANVQDVRIPDSGNGRVQVAHWSGGVRPSALGPNARAAGKLLSDTAMSKMNNEGLPTAPQAQFSPLAAMPKAGLMDKILGAAGPALSITGAMAPLLASGRPMPTPGKPGAPQLNPADLALGRLNNPALLMPGQANGEDPDDYLSRLRGE